MHPIQDLFLESFSYVLQFDMHFYMHSYVDKNFILVKSGCYTPGCLRHYFGPFTFPFPFEVFLLLQILRHFLSLLLRLIADGIWM
jgi:hypothetical protein